MNLTSHRTVEPLFIQAAVEMLEVDLDAAFTNQTDPDEILYYKIFSDYWLTAPVSEQLLLLSQVAKLVEASATSLNLTAGSPEPKET